MKVSIPCVCSSIGPCPTNYALRRAVFVTTGPSPTAPHMTLFVSLGGAAAAQVEQGTQATLTIETPDPPQPAAAAAPTSAPAAPVTAPATATS